jgi:ABC-type glycerol-3-phosphate transport system substrate-binding protein
MSKARKRPAPLALLAAALALVSLGAVGCGGSGGGAKTLRVAIVNNPQMEDIAKLTPSLFTKDTGIKVKYTVPTEATLREIVTRTRRRSSAPTAGSRTSPPTQRRTTRTTRVI